MTNSQQKHFYGSHNPSDWVNSEYPSFMVDVTGDFALFMTVDGEPGKSLHDFSLIGSSPIFSTKQIVSTA